MNKIRARLTRRLLPAFLLILSLTSTASAGTFHTLDTTQDGRIDIFELLRAIQFYNSLAYQCATGTEDNFQPGNGDTNCRPHDLDYLPNDWIISIDELMRSIQLYNSDGYQPDGQGEDGFTPGTHPIARAEQIIRFFDYCDSNEDHFLSSDEFELRNTTGSPLSDFDEDGDGLLSIFELIRANSGATTLTSATTPPTVTLLGEEIMTVICGQEFVDPGAIASDEIEGDITKFIVRNPKILDTSTAGYYSISYSVSSLDCLNGHAIRGVRIVTETPPLITLKGSNPATVNCGYGYYDPGATIDDACYQGNYAIRIDESQEDTSQLGSYTLTYEAVSDGLVVSTTQRTVNVVDTRPPTLRLSGNRTMALPAHTPWEEPGATATDTCDGDVPVKLPPAPDVDQLGMVTMVYKAEDLSGNVGMVERKVYFYDPLAPPLGITFTGDIYSIVPQFTPEPLVIEDTTAYFVANTQVEVTLDCWFDPYGSGMYDN